MPRASVTPDPGLLPFPDYKSLTLILSPEFQIEKHFSLDALKKAHQLVQYGSLKPLPPTPITPPLPQLCSFR